MPARAPADTAPQQASFVFKGTVLKLRASTMRDIDLTERTAIVRVDEVIHAPDELSQYAGQEVTVQLGGRKKAAKGQQLVLYTNGLLFGDSLAVESIDHDDPDHARAAAAATSDPVRRLAAHHVRRRIDSADAVVTGRVISVRLPEDMVDARARAATEPTAMHLSEHDPDWRIAEVQVDRVHKGEHRGATAQVRFSASDDVMWHHAPKLHTGHEGLFILHRGEREAAAARAAPVADPGEYVALHAADFQPADKLGDLQSVLDALPQMEPALLTE